MGMHNVCLIGGSSYGYAQCVFDLRQFLWVCTMYV